MNPYLDTAGFRAMTLMPPAAVDLVEQQQPGFVKQRIAVRSSTINAAARKRYGAATALGNSLPFGQRPPALVAAGTSPPVVTLIGRPVLGSMRVSIQVVAPGALGTATFAWSQDGGTTWHPDSPPALLAGAGVGIATAASVTLGTTGLAAQFPANVTYSADNLYQADTPVPGAILEWLCNVVTVDVFMRIGTNPQDPGITLFMQQYSEALAQIKEAADGKDGLLDLPISEDLGSAVTTGGVLSYSETSPYVWTDRERDAAYFQDMSGRGR